MKIHALLTAFLLLPAIAIAGQFNDARAIKGLKTVKVVCDVNVGEGNLLLRRLELIDETYTQLIDAGIRPAFVVVFRGPATKFVTRGTGYVDAGHRSLKEEIQGWIAQFHENGFVLEQCAIAARSQNVAYDDILPHISVVQNGYISIAAYQNKGYGFLPMD